MAVNNWIEANLIWITLAITILVLMYFVYAIIQTIRRKRSFVSQLDIILLIFGLMFLIFLTYHANEIEGKDWGQIILMLGLVIVTALYASSTEKQATASVKMAEEMREQRYDTVRPVIDIYRDPTDEDKLSEAFAATKGDASQGLSCALCNVGLGPAIDLCSFIQDSEQVRRRFNFGTLPIGEKSVLPRSLSLEQEDNRIALVVYYKDVYGRAFESSREVVIDKEHHNWEVRPLQIRLVKE